MNLNSKHILAIADSLKTLRVEFEGIRFFSGQGVLTPNGETNPSERNKKYKPSKSKNQNQNERNTDRKINNLQVTNAIANAGIRVR